MPLMPSHHIDLVAFYFSRQDRFGLASDDPLAQLLGHSLRVVRVRPQLPGDLGVG